MLLIKHSIILSESLNGIIALGLLVRQEKVGRGEPVTVEHKVRVPFAPKHTMSVGAEYTWHTRGWMQDITLGAIGKGNGRIYWNCENDLSQPFYALLDARLSVRHNDLELSLWGNNLTNTHYDAFCFTANAPRTRTLSQLGTPLQFGLDCRLRF